jgi:hypothetical protein
VAGCKVIIDLAGGEYTADAYYKKESPIPGIIFMIIFFGLISFRVAGGQSYVQDQLKKHSILDITRLNGWRKTWWWIWGVFFRLGRLWRI